MSLLRFLGLAPSPAPARGDTETVRSIAASLDALPPERARWIAAFAFLLCRVAKADLDLSTFSATMKGGSSGLIVAGGDPDGSSLYKVVAHSAEPTMPPDAPVMIRT